MPLKCKIYECHQRHDVPACLKLFVGISNLSGNDIRHKSLHEMQAQKSAMHAQNPVTLFVYMQFE